MYLQKAALTVGKGSSGQNLSSRSYHSIKNFPTSKICQLSEVSLFFLFISNIFLLEKRDSIFYLSYGK